tara:strand:+ start:238 stop:846 length:609 start_codon:yes stop_codon:yes gene_type:complete
LVLKFVKVLTDLLPKGKAWEESDGNLQKLKHGISDELGRVHTQITRFYNDFNILNSSKLANTHALDYGLISNRFTDDEMQHIIVEYVHGDYTLQAIIQDFSSFIGATVVFSTPAPSPVFGKMVFPFEFSTVSEDMLFWLRYEFGAQTTCLQYQKINYLANFFKPPHVKLTQDNTPIGGIQVFEFGSSQFGNSFGEIIECEIF